MRGRKRSLVGRGGHSSAEDADRGAMAGGGHAKAGEHETDTTGSRKRRRSQSISDGEDEQMSVDESNGNDDRLADENYPKLGMYSIILLRANFNQIHRTWQSFWRS